MSGGPGRREVAYRVFAAEYEDADLDHRESDEERAPNYVVTPTGARANRLFVVGVLTGVEQVNDDMLRARVADPTGAFVVYAGQYQPDARAFFERAEPPAYVAVTGKARTFSPEGSDRVFTSLRPESVNEVDADTRDRWTVGTAEQTLARVATMAAAVRHGGTGDDRREWLLARGVEEGLAAGVPLALAHYGTTPGYLAAVREMALQAAEVVAGDREAVDPPGLAPGDPGEGADVAALADPDLAGFEGEAGGAGETGAAEPVEAGETGTAEAGATGPDEPAEPADGGETEVADTGETEVADAGETEVADEGQTEVADADEAEPAGGAEPSGTGDAEAQAAEATEGAGAEPDAGAGDAADAGDDVLGEAERERIEAEHGTDFETAAEVDEPGTADIDVPGDEPEDAAAAEAEETAEAEATAEAEETDQAADDAGEADEGADALEDAAVDAMVALDEGDGADRAAVVERVREETGAGEDAVEDAIQDALMDGRCYEPDDETLKPI